MSAKTELIKRFLTAARSLASQGMSKEAIMRFAKNEFGEISELFKKQIDNIFKRPASGIEKIKIKDEVFDDTVVKLPIDDQGKPFNPRNPLKQYDKPKKTDDFNLSEDDPLGDLEKIIKGEGDTGLPKKPRDEKYTGGIVDVEPSLSDIGHGSDALMSRTRLMSPGSHATTSTGLNYLLAEDNDNIRVPFQEGLSAAKKYGNILVEDETITDKGKEILKEKLDELTPSQTEKEKKEKEMFDTVKEFQKFKRANPNSPLSFRMFAEQKKKEKEIFKNKILELAVKYPDKKIINKEGFVDKKELKKAIDQAEADLEISPVEGLTLKRSIDTEGDQSVTAGTFDINNFSFSSPSLEEGKLTSSANFDIGNLNLSGTLDTKDSDILKSGIGFNFDDMLKGEFSESDGLKKGKLNLDKTFPINDKFKLNFTGDSNIIITPDGETYKRSDLTPKLSYNDGILSADVSKSILEGSDTPNLNVGASFPLFEKKFTGDLILDSEGKIQFDSKGNVLRKPDYTKDMGLVTLKGSNLLSDDRSGTIGYQKEFGDKDGDLFFTAGGEKSLFDDDYTLGAGLKYKFADGGRIGFSKGKLALKKLDKGRRKFMKLAGTGAAGLAALKTGLIGLAEKAGPKVEKVTENFSTTLSEAPQYFLDLVTKIKSFGKKSKIGPQERMDEYYYTGKNGDQYILTEDIVTGDAQIVKDKMGVGSYGDKTFDTINDRTVMEYKAPKQDVDVETGKGTREAAEYEEFKVEFDADGTEAGADAIDESIQKEIIEEASEKITKKASGGIARLLGE